MGVFSKDLGPCAITFDGTDVGAIKDAKFTAKDSRVKRADSRFGSSAKDYIITGGEVKLVANLAETTLATLAALMHGVTLTGDELMLSNATGTNVSDKAGELVLKPIIDNVASADAADWLTFFRAVSDVQADIGFDGENERVFQVEFEALPVITVPTGESYAVGDKAAIGYGETV